MSPILYLDDIDVFPDEVRPWTWFLGRDLGTIIGSCRVPPMVGEIKENIPASAAADDAPFHRQKRSEILCLNLRKQSLGFLSGPTLIWHTTALKSSGYIKLVKNSILPLLSHANSLNLL